MVLLAMEPGRVDVLATELKRVRLHIDEIALIVDLARTLSELEIASMNRLHEAGGRCEVAAKELLESAETIQSDIGVPEDSTSLIISRGDTLTSIAKDAGTSVGAIVAANDKITDPDKIFAGDTIVIPGPAGETIDPPETDGGSSPPHGTDDSAGLVGGPEVGLTLEDFKAIAIELGVEVAAIQAVAQVEAAGDGFLPSGRPKILFEGAQFRGFTDGRFDISHPHLSHPYPQSGGHYVGGEGEHDRLDEALTLDPTAALKSASWGRFQIMGFNYQAAGYDSVESYVEAMRISEANHLEAFASFIESNPTMHQALQNRDWETFALHYNGSDFARGGYHIKMAEAYLHFLEEARARGEG